MSGFPAAGRSLMTASRPVSASVSGAAVVSPEEDFVEISEYFDDLRKGRENSDGLCYLLPKQAAGASPPPYGFERSQQIL